MTSLYKFTYTNTKETLEFTVVATGFSDAYQQFIYEHKSYPIFRGYYNMMMSGKDLIPETVRDTLDSFDFKHPPEEIYARFRDYPRFIIDKFFKTVSSDTFPEATIEELKLKLNQMSVTVEKPIPKVTLIPCLNFEDHYVEISKDLRQSIDNFSKIFSKSMPESLLTKASDIISAFNDLSQALNTKPIKKTTEGDRVSARDFFSIDGDFIKMLNDSLTRSIINECEENQIGKDYIIKTTLNRFVERIGDRRLVFFCQSTHVPGLSELVAFGVDNGSGSLIKMNDDDIARLRGRKYDLEFIFTAAKTHPELLSDTRFRD